MLSGPIDDLKFDFTAAGEAFQITQEQVRFAASLDRILATTDSNGLICFRVALKPLTITIGATHVRGTTHSADAGPFDIRMGIRYPIWIEVRMVGALVRSERDARHERHDRLRQVRHDPLERHE